MSAVRTVRRPRSRPAITSHLPHWSEVARDETRPRPSPTVAAVLHDLVSWAADVAIVLTHGCPEDRTSIERVRGYAHAWLGGESCPDVSITDVLTTAAALMAQIDRDLGGTTPHEDELAAIGASVLS